MAEPHEWNTTPHLNPAWPRLPVDKSRYRLVMSNPPNEAVCSKTGDAGKKALLDLSDRLERLGHKFERLERIEP